MDRGEHAIIDSDIRHCYGEIGCEEKQIPPVSADNSYRMKVDLEFHDWKYPPDIPTLSIEQRLYWRFVELSFIFLNFCFFILVIKNDKEEIFHIAEKIIQQHFNVIKLL
jgi:hypothetical protein